jgi:hypothetical protein
MLAIVEKKFRLWQFHPIFPIFPNVKVVTSKIKYAHANNMLQKIG